METASHQKDHGQPRCFHFQWKAILSISWSSGHSCPHQKRQWLRSEGLQDPYSSQQPPPPSSQLMSQLRSQVTISLPFTPGTPFQMQAAMKVSCHCASPGGISLPSLSQRQDSSRETGSGLLSFRVVLPYLGIRASITNEVGDNRGGQPLISAELGERESDRRLLFPPPSQGPQEAAWDICSQRKHLCQRDTH